MANTVRRFYLKAHTGPTIVKAMADKFRAAGLEVVSEGTEAVYVVVQSDERGHAVRDFLNQLHATHQTVFGYGHSDVKIIREFEGGIEPPAGWLEAPWGEATHAAFVARHRETGQQWVLAGPLAWDHRGALSTAASAVGGVLNITGQSHKLDSQVFWLKEAK